MSGFQSRHFPEPVVMDRRYDKPAKVLGTEDDDHPSSQTMSLFQSMLVEIKRFFKHGKLRKTPKPEHQPVYISKPVLQMQTPIYEMYRRKSVGEETHPRTYHTERVRRQITASYLKNKPVPPLPAENLKAGPAHKLEIHDTPHRYKSTHADYSYATVTEHPPPMPRVRRGSSPEPQAMDRLTRWSDFMHMPQRKSAVKDTEHHCVFCGRGDPHGSMTDRGLWLCSRCATADGPDGQRPPTMLISRDTARSVKVKTSSTRQPPMSEKTKGKQGTTSYARQPAVPASVKTSSYARQSSEAYTDYRPSTLRSKRQSTWELPPSRFSGNSSVGDDYTQDEDFINLCNNSGAIPPPPAAYVSRHTSSARPSMKPLPESPTLPQVHRKPVASSIYSRHNTHKGLKSAVFASRPENFKPKCEYLDLPLRKFGEGRHVLTERQHNPAQSHSVSVSGLLSSRASDFKQSCKVIKRTMTSPTTTKIDKASISPPVMLATSTPFVATAMEAIEMTRRQKAHVDRHVPRRKENFLSATSPATAERKTLKAKWPATPNNFAKRVEKFLASHSHTQDTLSREQPHSRQGHRFDDLTAHDSDPPTLGSLESLNEYRQTLPAHLSVLEWAEESSPTPTLRRRPGRELLRHTLDRSISPLSYHSSDDGHLDSPPSPLSSTHLSALIPDPLDPHPYTGRDHHNDDDNGSGDRRATPALSYTSWSGESFSEAVIQPHDWIRPGGVDELDGLYRGHAT